MKTKRIEIKTWRRDCPIDMGQGSVSIFIRRELSMFEKLPIETEITLSFEVPVPERKVEITESRLDELLQDWGESDSLSSYQFFLKQKLFGEEWGK